MLGLSVANVLAAVDGGASWISCTVGGLGERGGNTPLGEVLACLWRFFGDERYNLAPLTQLSQEVQRRSGVQLGASAGVTAEFGFAYEVAGQWRNPEIFEAVPAELVGARRQVRVRDRLRPQLITACVPSELTDGVDLEAVVEHALARLGPDRGPLGVDDLVAAVRTHLDSRE